ncbi:MAG TPA: OmpA family protein [Candidatus Kapabacteria bacterium]|nr:OmpA family protein [Candidatus Kapabacteria bacterium]
MLKILLISLTLASAAFAQIEKLPTEVNDPVQSEVLPVISADGKWLYFARARTALDGSTVVDIWQSRHIIVTDSFKQAHIFGGHLGSRFGIAVTSVAPDNNTLFVIGKLRRDQKPEDRVMVSHRTKDGWQIPQPIHIQNLNAKSNVIDFAFGPDERTLIMSMKSDSSLGGRDLYVCFLDEATNSWTSPEWLGDEINSANDEITPYLAADGKTLYFSSDRAGNFGEMDVWRSERLDDSWKHWSKPEHLDKSINRIGRTTYYTEDAEGAHAYFVWRANANDETDIYRSVAPPRITPVVLVNGAVHDETGSPLGAVIRYERLRDGKTMGIAYSDPSSGEYQITLAAGESYALFAEDSGFLPTSERFDATNIKAFSTIKKDLTLVKIKENAIVRLNNIFFETDKSDLLAASFAELNRLATILQKDPALRISIEGHTDSTGSAEHNKKLSAARAQSVVDYLIKAKIPSSRLESDGFGSEKPVAPNETEEGRALNRRVEFRILKSSGL